MKKMSKKDYFNILKEIVKDTNHVLKAELIYFLETQIDYIDNKAQKAKQRAEIKKQENDLLKEEIKNILTNEYQSIEDITNQLDNISRSKVIARLTQLINEDLVEKTDIKRKKVYRLK